MTRAKPTLTSLSEMVPGQKADFFALLADRVHKVTREGKPYFACRFRDARRSVWFMAWGDSPWYPEAELWQEGQSYKVRATYTEHEKYGPQIDPDKIRPIKEEDRADGFDESHFIERSRFDPEILRSEMHTLATHHIKDIPLLQLVLLLLDNYAEPLSRLPASRDRAFAFVGGLLEHTVSVARIAIDLCQRYADYYTELQPRLNGDLVTAAALLFGLGRLKEFEDAPTHPLTIEGRLVGAPLLCRDLVRETARSVPELNPELLQLLEHILLSYMLPVESTNESRVTVGPRYALIPEALILYHAQRLDQEMELYVRCISRDTGPGPFTDRDPILGRVLLKNRKI